MQRVDAITYAQTHGGAILTRQTPTGGAVRLGVCPGCKKAVRYFYLLEGVAACERCHNLTRATRQQAHTAREELRHDPALLGRALDSASTWADSMENGMPNDRELNQSLRILEAASSPGSTPPTMPPTAPRDALTSELIEKAQVSAEAGLQERVICSDVARTTALLEKVEAIINGGFENVVNRMGEPGRVPLTVSSLTKLIHAYVAVSNVRAARSGLATQIVEDRSEGGGANALTTALREAGRGRFDKDGYSLDELEKIAAGEIVPQLKPAAPKPETGQTWEVEESA